jgi:hypothetical protein
MPTNQYLPFAATGGSPNTLTPAAYAALTAITGNGFVSGQANSTQVNTVLRQVSVVAAALAQFIVDFAAVDANDDGSVANFETKFKSALDALYAPLSALSGLVATSTFTGTNQSLAASGYQKLPGGLQLCWGSVSVASGGSVTVSWARNFSATPYQVVVSADSNRSQCGVTAKTASNVTVTQLHDSGSTAVISYFAIGPA